MARQSWPTDPRTPHLRWDRDPRSGKPRCYYRNREVEGSAQIRLREAFITDAFIAEYERAHASVTGGTAAKKARVDKWQRPGDKPAVEHKPGGVASLNYLFGRYFQSGSFLRELDEITQSQRRRRVDRAMARDFDSAAWGKVKLGELPFAKLSADFLVELQDDYAAKPTAGVALIKDFRVAFKWALKRKAAFPGLTHNPAEGVEPLEGLNTDGWRQWTKADAHRFLDHYRGERPAEWLTILLYTGARRGNASKLNDDMVFDGISSDGKPCKMLAFTVAKGQNRKRRKGKQPVTVSIPILPPLAACLANMERPEGEKHWILGWRNGPYTCDDSVTHAVHDAAKAIGIKGSPHGLRKLGAALAAENGASHADMMAIFGWETMSQPDLYIRKFSRQRTATRSMHLVELPPARAGRGPVPLQSRRQSHKP
jgi:integrase